MNLFKAPIWILVLLSSFLADKLVYTLLNPFRNSYFSSFFEFFSLMNLFIILFLVTTLIIYMTKKDFNSIKSLYFSLFGTLVVVGLLKLIIGRERPLLGFETDMFSFPSGHSALAFSALPVLKSINKNLFMGLFIFATLVAISRLTLGVHYLSDVLFGSVIGYGLGLLGVKFFEKRNL